MHRRGVPHRGRGEWEEGEVIQIFLKMYKYFLIAGEQEASSGVDAGETEAAAPCSQCTRPQASQSK